MIDKNKYPFKSFEYFASHIHSRNPYRPSFPKLMEKIKKKSYKKVVRIALKLLLQICRTNYVRHVSGDNGVQVQQRDTRRKLTWI